MTSDEFRKWRERLHLTQSEAASFLSVSEQTIYLYEAGKRPGAKARLVLIPRPIAIACHVLYQTAIQAVGISEDQVIWVEDDLKTEIDLIVSALDDLHQGLEEDDTTNDNVEFRVRSRFNSNPSEIPDELWELRKRLSLALIEDQGALLEDGSTDEEMIKEMLCKLFIRSAEKKALEQSGILN